MTQDVPTTQNDSLNATAQAPQSTTPIHHKRRKRQKIYAGFEEPYNGVRGESALWVAVITQAMMDALSRSRHPEALYHKQAALQWLTGNSKDFFLVCLFAGMDPDYVRRKAKKSLLSPITWRAAPGQGKRYLERKVYRQRIKKSDLPDYEPPPEIQLNAPPPAAHIITGPWR